MWRDKMVHKDTWICCVDDYDTIVSSLTKKTAIGSRRCYWWDWYLGLFPQWGTTGVEVMVLNAENPKLSKVSFFDPEVYSITRALCMLFCLSDVNSSSFNVIFFQSTSNIRCWWCMWCHEQWTRLFFVNLLYNASSPSWNSLCKSRFLMI